MKINVDRLCQLAGVGGKSSGLLRESAYDAMEEESGPGHISDMFSEVMEGDDMGDMFAEAEEEEKEDLDEEIEIDEVELVQELRRMKRLMNENKRRQAIKTQRVQAARRQALQEAHLKSVIEEEVQNIMDELNISADWVYGENQPKKSRKGFVHQGSFLKGIGFK
jgi:hypothetical protein